MKELIPVLEKLAGKLGVTTDYLWGVMIKQASITAVTDIIQYIVITIVSYLVFKKAIKYNWNSDKFPFIPIAAGFMGIMVIMVFFAFPNTLTALINPEYWALDKILSAIKKG
jgi:hypothetical protein